MADAGESGNPMTAVFSKAGGISKARRCEKTSLEFTVKMVSIRELSIAMRFFLRFPKMMLLAAVVVGLVSEVRRDHRRICADLIR